MTVMTQTESPAAAGTRILLETTRATWRFTAIRGLLDIGAFEQLATGPLTADDSRRGVVPTPRSCAACSAASRRPVCSVRPARSGTS